MSYASETRVPIGRSQEEIKKILVKYNANSFMMGESPENAMIAFELKGRRIKMLLPTLVYGMKSPKNKYRTLSNNEVDQENRRRWRCLVIAIKAKLECVESGITTLEQEFMAHIVLPDGSTVGQFMTPQIESSYKTGNMPPLIGHRS